MSLFSQLVVTERKQEYIRIAEEKGTRAAIEWLNNFYDAV
jgi:hypothetical protein